MLYRPAPTLWRMTLADRVKAAVAAAKRRGHSVADIATAAGIKDKSIYQWMNGDTQSIEGAHLVELAEKSGYRALWIIKGEGPREDGKTPQQSQALQLMDKMTPARQSIAVKILGPLADQDEDEPPPEEFPPERKRA